MIKKSVILIPTIEPINEICDFVSQTSKCLVNHKNIVYVVGFEYTYSLKEILSGILNKKKLKFISVKDDVRFLTPIYLIPFKRFNLINKFNQFIYFFILQLILRIRFKNSHSFLCWMFFPHYSHLLLLNFWPWKIVYDIIDFHTFFDPIKNKKIQEQKKYLLRKSDYIFSISTTLKKEYQKFTKKNILVSPQGFDNQIFTNHPKTVVKLPKNKPIIGFIGKIDERLDFDLLQNMIFQKNDWQFVFIGPKKYANILSNKKVEKTAENLLSYKNVLWIDKIQKNQIPNFIKQFAVCIIPYDVKLKFNLYSYPMKIFEYFYLQKPVVSTRIKELMDLKFDKLIFTSNDYKEWIEQITKALASSQQKKDQNSQLKIAKSNSWENKLEFISQHIST